MAAKTLPFPLEYGTNFAEECVPGGSKFPAANQRNVLELLFHVKGLHLQDNWAEVCEFCVLLGNYLHDVPSKDQYNLQLNLYRRVQVLDTKFRAQKHSLQKRGNLGPAWGPIRNCRIYCRQSSGLLHGLQLSSSVMTTLGCHHLKKTAMKMLTLFMTSMQAWLQLCQF